MDINWDEIPNKIWMRGGKIVVCSTLKDTTPRLFACIEDNIFETDGDEYIDWCEVERDYQAIAAPATESNRR